MQSHLIVLRTTAVGALCAAGAVLSCTAFGPASEWLPYAVVVVTTLIMWVLGRTLQIRLLQVARIGEVARSHAMQMQDSTEAARVMAASVADRALAESQRARNPRPPTRSIDNTAALTDRALAKAEEVRQLFDRPLPGGSEAERHASATAAGLREANKLANAALRSVVNAALEAARAGRPEDFTAVTAALREICRRCDDAATDHAGLLTALAESRPAADATLGPAHTGMAELVDDLATLRRELATNPAGRVSPPSGEAAAAADALVALCVDARYIEHELGTLQGARIVEDIGEYQLPPDPLDWDELDAQVQRDVRRNHETGNIALLDEP